MKTKQGGKLSILIFPINVFLLMAGIFLWPQNPARAAALTADNIMSAVNQERQKIELPALSANSRLAQAAADKARDLLSAQSFAHNLADKKFSDWVKETGYRYAVVGENLAIHFSDTAPLFNAWLASPAHKQNILHPDYSEIGVAVVSGDWRGQPSTLVVTIFARPTEHAELLVPLTAGIASTPAAPPLTSNLAENYLESIVYTDAAAQSYGAPLALPAPLTQNKTALLNYFGLAAQVMSLYTALMIALVAAYGYAAYFIKLSRLLRKLQKYQYGG